MRAEKGLDDVCEFVECVLVVDSHKISNVLDVCHGGECVLINTIV